MHHTVRSLIGTKVYVFFAPAGNSPDELTAELGGRSIMDLNPVELKEELLKASP